jgi:hypothetical protein
MCDGLHHSLTVHDRNDRPKHVGRHRQNVTVVRSRGTRTAINVSPCASTNFVVAAPLAGHPCAEPKAGP